MKKKQEQSLEEKNAEINFGKMVKRIRKELNLTQNDVADRTELTTQTISHIENHGQNLGIGTIKLFAIAFNMTLAEMFSYYEE